MQIVGLTGGIGSGKTIVSKVFRLLGVPIFNSDIVAKNLYQNPEIIQLVNEILGAEVLNNNKELDRKRMAEIIFANPKKLQEINSLIHPKVNNEFKEFCKTHQHCIYIIKEAAILFESGSSKDCDKIISVIAPMEEKIERLKKRDSMSLNEIKQRIQHQISDEERVKKSNFIIYNNHKELLIPQVIEIDKKIKLEVSRT